MGCTHTSSIKEKVSNNNSKLKRLSKAYRNSIKRNPLEVQEYLEDGINRNSDGNIGENSVCCMKSRKNSTINLQFKIVLDTNNSLIKVFTVDIDPFNKFSHTLSWMISKYSNSCPYLKSINIDDCSFKNTKINPGHSFAENGIKSGDLINITCNSTRTTNMEEEGNIRNRRWTEEQNKDDDYFKNLAKHKAIKDSNKSKSSQLLMSNNDNNKNNIYDIFNEFINDDFKSDFNSSNYEETSVELEL